MTRALVLGGGGPVGIAWETGLIAGLAEGGVDLAEADFIWATQKIMDLADGCAGGRVISLLEGGYDLQALGNSVAAHVATLMHA